MAVNSAFVWKVFITPSFLKSIFFGYRILDWHFYLFGNLKLFILFSSSFHVFCLQNSWKPLLLVGPVSFSWLLGFPLYLCFQQFAVVSLLMVFVLFILLGVNWALESASWYILSVLKNSWSLSLHILLLLYYCFFLSDTPVINMLYCLCPMCSLFSSLSFYSCFLSVLQFGYFQLMHLQICQSCVLPCAVFHLAHPIS